MMNPRVKVWTVAISFALVLSVPLWAALQEKTAEKPAPAAAQAAKPGAGEIDRLKFYLGEWDYTQTYPKSASYPGGGKNTRGQPDHLGPGRTALTEPVHLQATRR